MPDIQHRETPLADKQNNLTPDANILMKSGFGVDSASAGGGLYLGQTNAGPIHVGPSVTLLPPPSGDSTGATDYANLNPLLTASGFYQLQAGTYYINQGISSSVDNVQIRGVGDGSIIAPVGNFNALSFASTVAGTFRYGIKLRDFMIDCTNSTGGDALTLGLTYFALVDNIRINRCRGNAIHLDGPGGANGFGAYTTVRKCVLQNSVGSSAIGILTSNHEHSLITDGLIQHYNVGGKLGIKSQNAAVRIDEMEFDDNDTAIGLFFNQQNRISNCYFDRGITRFIHFQGCKYSVVEGCNFSAFNGSGSKNVIDVDNGGNAANFVNGCSMVSGTSWTTFITEAVGTGTPGNRYSENYLGGLTITLVSGTTANNF